MMKKMKKPNIKKIEDIDKFISRLEKRSMSDIERLFAERLRMIKRTLLEMAEKYERETPELTWTEYNKYNRLNKELSRIAKTLDGDYRRIAKTIKKSNANTYLTKYMAAMYVYEQFSGIKMQASVPSNTVIEKALEQPIEGIKILPTLKKHKDSLIQKLKNIIAHSIMSGEGYSKLAKHIKKELNVSYNQALRVARTESGRAYSLAMLDSMKKAKENGFELKKRWIATKDMRTRDTHRHLDGVTVDYEGTFKSSGCVAPAPKLFIGVNSAKENINCRCKLLTFTDEDELPTVMRVRNDDGSSSVVPYQTFNEWYNERT